MTASQSRASKGRAQQNACLVSTGKSVLWYQNFEVFCRILRYFAVETLSLCLKEQHKVLGHRWAHVGAARGCTHREGAAHPQPEEHSALNNQLRVFFQYWMVVSCLKAKRDGIYSITGYYYDFENKIAICNKIKF